jgi:hypothetical protein
MAKVIKVTGEQPFQVEAPHFAISPSDTGYTLAYSADGVHYDEWPEGTLAEKTQVVACAARGMYFKLLNNGSEVTVTY